VLPLGDKTPAAHAAVRTVRAKVDDYFARCRLAEYDARAQAALNSRETAYLDVAAHDLSITSQEVAHFPLALIEANKPLPLEGGLNPYWADAVAKLRKEAVAPLLGKDRTALTEAEWAAIGAKLAAHEAWQATKAGGAVEKLGLARVREILSGKAREALAAALAEDRAVAGDVGAIAQVEKLARYHRDLFGLFRNFVSFIDFYSRKMAVFQAGTLYLDARACHLCVRVTDPGKHGILAVMSKAYLAYVDCSRASGEKMTVAVAMTAGDSDNLFVGRNGIFYDRAGRDWDATIAKVIENPISIRQAFWSPYKKLLRWIESTAMKRAAAADEASTGMLQKAATTAGTAAETGKAPPPSGKKLDIGVVAAIGVAVGGIATAVSALLSSFFGLGLWMPVGVLGLLLLISGPAMLIAWLKLRQRNLGPILDANGWAVNALAKVNIPLGAALTDRAKLPKGASRSLVDPYKPKKRIWARLFVFLVLVGAIGYGLHAAGIVDWVDIYHDVRNGIFGEPKAEPGATPSPAADPSTTPPPGTTPPGPG
jgi:hypothetical protein